jgi:heparinase II/III-like protein
MQRSPRPRSLPAQSQVSWYFQRLRSMSATEVAWRSSQFGRRMLPRPATDSLPASRLLGTDQQVDWTGLLHTFRERPSPLLSHARAQTIAASHRDLAENLVSTAERVAEGGFRFFGYPEAVVGSRVDWHYDPLNDVRWPQVASNRIDHRNFPGDAKWIWELNRLQHLPWLAEAWLFTGEERFAALALDHLDSWMEQNPVGCGVAWRGGFETAIRSLSVVTVLEGLRNSAALTHVRFERIVRMLAASADRAWRERSRFSSANNHLVAELAGAAVVAMAFPELRRSPKWKQDALDNLATVASRQILPDGAGAEQASAYQLFTIELLMLVAARQRARGEEPPDAIGDAINRSSRFLVALVGDGEPEPRFGDDDGGFALRLGPEPVRTIRDHLGIVGAFTGNPEIRAAGNLNLTAAWLAKADLSDSLRSPAPGSYGSFFAPHGGTVVLRSAARRLVMDVGPLGYLSIAAHGHADALSVTLSVDGRELVGDPGTASYYGHPDWRAAHRSTRMHATATVDDVDQSEVGGPFLWRRHAHVRVHHVDLQRGVVDADHDGYERLPEPVTHRRWLVAPPERTEILVVDLLEGKGEHHLRTSWPLPPDLEASPSAHGQVIDEQGRTVLHILYAASAGGVELDQVKGDLTSNLGWWSDRLESREPSWLVSGSTRGPVPTALATLLNPARSGACPIDDLAIRYLHETISVSWGNGGARRTVLIDTSRPGAVHMGD